MRNRVGAFVCYSKWRVRFDPCAEPRSFWLLRVADVGAKCLPRGLTCPALHSRCQQRAFLRPGGFRETAGRPFGDNRAACATSLFGDRSIGLNLKALGFTSTASLFHPDGPNDLAPVGYNLPANVDPLPRSPLPPEPHETGFRWGSYDARRSVREGP